MIILHSHSRLHGQIAYEPERESMSSVHDPHLLTLLSAHGQRQLQL